MFIYIIYLTNIEKKKMKFNAIDNFLLTFYLVNSEKIVK